jgi:hypothetical protein
MNGSNRGPDAFAALAMKTVVNLIPVGATRIGQLLASFENPAERMMPQGWPSCLSLSNPYPGRGRAWNTATMTSAPSRTV